MNFFDKLFGRERPPVTEFKAPDDTEIKEKLSEARKDNREAVKGLILASRKQQRDAAFARHVISEVLERAEKSKASKDADYATDTKQ